LFLCTNSRAEQLSDAELLQRCGSNLNASPAQAPVVPVSDQRLRGLDNLKWSFLLFMIGGALTFVPLIGLISGLVYIVALVFLIVGWRNLGRSTLAEAQRYKSTGSWLIYSIVVAVVVAVIGIVIVSIQLVSAELALGSTRPSFQAIFQSEAFRNLEGEIFALTGAALVVPLVAWYRVITSLMRLADEVSQPRLRTAGWLLLTFVLIGLGSSAVLSAMFYTGVISFPTSTTTGGLGVFYAPYSSYYFYLSFAGYVGVAFLVISFVGEGLLILASYLGYKGLKGALYG